MTAGDIIVVNEDGSGKKGNYLDGVDDYVLHDAHAVARVAANDTTGTYSAWVYVDDITGTETVLSAGDNNSATEYLRFDIITGRLRIIVYHGGANQFSVVETTGSITARKWHHVAVVHNGTRPILYVDGVASAMTDTVSTDLTYWYDELTGCDKFAIGILESNATHLNDFKGAIGQVKYWNKALTAKEVLADKNGEALSDDGTYLQLNVTMEDDGTTDSGLGEDDGTLTGNAYYGGLISDWSYKLNANVTGHAAEEINTILDGNKFRTIIKRGD